jgi:hypothetical protein
MSEKKPVALVSCERLDNESFCVSVIRELEAYYEVRPFGPNWPHATLEDVDREGARFLLELDSASGNLYHAQGLERLNVPKFAWLVDTHKKPDFHRAVAREMDLTFFAMKNWGHVFDGNAVWLPLHGDTEIWRPVACPRELDVVFVGSYGWRAQPLLRIARKHGLKVHVECTTGPREKSETAKLYAKAKIVFNKHVTNDLNFRVFEATACGRVLLTDAQWNGQYELFEDEKHLVFYKDERDLEEKLLRYLRDDDARARVEGAAAEHAARFHSTRARVGQLHALIEAHLARGEPTVAGPKRRWLFFVGAAVPSVTGLTYGERLARDLASRGDEVVVARARRGVLTPRERAHGLGEPRLVELEVGPLPERGFTAAAALHAAFERLAGELGRLDGIVGDGPLGALVAQPVAARRDVRFFLALEDCEVLRRGNKLTREQLYGAELEHWGVDRARAVVVASRETEDAVRRHYRARTVVTITPSPRVAGAPEAGSLVKRLGLEGVAFAAFLTAETGEREKAAILAGTRDTALLLADDVWLKKSSGEVARISREPATGAVLAAILKAASVVVPLSARDPRAEEARALGCRIHREACLEGRGVEALEELLQESQERELAHAVR